VRVRAHGGHVRAGGGLRQAEAGELLAAGLRSEVALLLLLVGIPEQAERVQADMDRDQRTKGGFSALDLLADEGLGDEVHPGPAVLLRDRDPEQAELRHSFDDAHLEVMIDVVLDGVGKDALVDELPDRPLDFPLLRCELEIH
jgi:hypothetical protein